MYYIFHSIYVYIYVYIYIYIYMWKKPPKFEKNPPKFEKLVTKIWPRILVLETKIPFRGHDFRTHKPRTSAAQRASARSALVRGLCDSFNTQFFRARKKRGKHSRRAKRGKNSRRASQKVYSLYIIKSPDPRQHQRGHATRRRPRRSYTKWGREGERERVVRDNICVRNSQKSDLAKETYLFREPTHRRDAKYF